MPSDVIRFIHNNEIIEISNFDPNETLLAYIREKLKKTGTKEGCAEGGCGACTVVIGSLINNTIEYQSINACIMFLPTLNGKQLILVEDLLSNDGKLHPVQESMVKFHGSQCGFCTPGFVMSLFAMYKNNFVYNDTTIKDNIAGNLCRCTGYKPIIDAARNLNNKSKIDKFSRNNESTIKLLRKINNKSLKIKYKNINYFAPNNIKELKEHINKMPNITILSGGTDLSLEITKKLKSFNSLIYIGSIKELNYIKKNNDFFEIGAATPLIKIEKFSKKFYPDFYEILKRYGSTQIRNVATITGNIATASPIGDTLPILLSLNASLTIGSIKKDANISINDFFISYRKTALKKGHFIKSVKIPIIKNRIFKAYKISKRIDDDISSVCGSFNIKIKDNNIKDILIAFGGMSEIPKRALNCEKILINKKLSIENIQKAQDALNKDFHPISDMRASSKYRLEVAKNLLLKLFLEIKNKKQIRINE